VNALAWRLVLAASVAVSALSAPLPGAAAGRPQAGQEPGKGQQPSFRATTELVVVDVSALGEDGTPVKDLQVQDFTATIDGAPRRIGSLKFVDQSAAEAPAARAQPGARFSSNESGSAGRLILILVDEGSIRFGGLRAAAESIERLLAGFGPADRIALVTLPNARTLVDFTSDQARIAAAVKSIPGGAGEERSFGNYYLRIPEAFAIDQGDSTIRQAVIDRECPPSGVEREACITTIDMEVRRIVISERSRTTEFVSSLRSFFIALRAIDAPKLVVVFSEGFAAPDAPLAMASLGRDAADARAVIYAMRLDRSMFDVSIKSLGRVTDAFEDRHVAINGLDALAGSALGRAFEIIGSAESPFKRLAAEVSGYYLLGVEPEGSDHDGRVHQIRVGVSRPNVTLRFRRDFAYRAAGTNEKKIFEGTMASPLVATDLPLRVATFNLADDDPQKVQVLVVAEIGRDAPLEGSATVGLMVTDEKGRSPLTTARRTTLPRGPSGALQFTGKFPLPAGAYTMKFAAVYDGKAGSVEHRLVARLTPPEAAASKPAGSVPQIGDLMVMPPVAVRGVAALPIDGRVRGERIVGLTHVGVDPKSKDGRTYVFDVVKQDQGPALASAPGSIDPKAKGRSRAVQATVDAGLLPPGDYALRLTVSAGGAAVTTLLAPFVLERLSPAERAAEPAGLRGAPPADAAKFKPQDVLEASVLGPFLDEVARLAPETSRPALEEAKSGQFAAALKKVKPGKAADPTEPFIRGLLFLSLNQLQPASGAFREAIAAAPELLVGAFYIGACYAAGGMDEGAVNAWQTSLIGLAQHQAVYRLLADGLIRMGQSGRARAIVEEAVRKWPDDELLRAQAMRVNLEAGQYEQALDAADRILARQPSDTATLFLAMRSIFQAVLDGKSVRTDVLMPKLERYQDLYVAAGGPQQALTAEWVAFVRGRM
jgi:VWFA-related protein